MESKIEVYKEIITDMLEKASEKDLRIIWFFINALLKEGTE